ncbi:MAG TPA: hypothetical protein VGG73_23360 [Vicinamibacterales bacterium]|jgi:hypothetical protein
MKLKSLLTVLCTLALLGATACQKDSATRPSDDLQASSGSAAVTDASTGVSVTSPQLTTPTVNQIFKFADQPLTLTVKDGAHTGKSAATYTFEVATDSAFTAKVYSNAAVAEGPGSTSQKIDTLPGPAAKTYYWRARMTSGAAVSQYTTIRSFSVGAQVVIQAPQVSTPASGSTLGSNGTISVVNASRTGSVGTMTYRFDVSDSSAFTNIVFTASTPEQPGVTGVSMTTKLVSNATYYWRAQVTDSASGVVSPYSTTATFRFVPFSMTDATIVSSPPDLGSWAETATITSVVFTDEFLVDFDRRDGPNRWGDTPFGEGALQYTLGMCGNINNHWYCSAVVQFWYGRELSASGSQFEVASQWFYDPARWGPMTGYQPAQGETVGLFVASGNLRNAGYTQASCPSFCERSNVQFVNWGANGALNSAVKTFKGLRR